MAKQSWLGAFTSRLRPATKADVNQLKELIMANQKDLLAKIAALELKVDAQTTQLTNVAGIAVKVGTETDGLKAIIAELREAVNNGEVSTELADSVDRLEQKFQAQSSVVEQLTGAVNAVDEKVDEAPTQSPVEG